MTTSVVPEIDAVAKQYKQKLTALDAQVMNDLASRYAKVYDVARKELLQVMQKRLAARQLGEPEAIGWQYRQERLIKLMKDVGTEVQKFVDQTQNQLPAAQTQAMREAMAYAQVAAQAALGPVPAGQSFGSLWTQLPQQALLNIVANTAEGPLADILQQIAPQAATDARDVIVNGVAQGYNPRKVAQLLRTQLGAPLARAQTIARTEILRAQREVSQQTFENNPTVVGGWIWQAALDDRTCEFCWAMNGEHFDVEEELDTHPNCRCTMVPDVTSYQDAGFGAEAAAAYTNVMTPDFYDPGGIAPEIVRQGGNVDLTDGTVDLEYVVANDLRRNEIERTGIMPSGAIMNLKPYDLPPGFRSIRLKVPLSELGEPISGRLQFADAYAGGEKYVTRYLQSGPAQFELLSDARKLKILGPAKFRAYKAGAVNLRDFIGWKDSPVWGRNGYARSLKEILGPTAARRFYVPSPSERRVIERAKEIQRRQNIARRIQERDLQRAARQQAAQAERAAAQAAQESRVALPPPQPTEVLSQVEADLSSKPVSIIRDMSDGHHNPAYKSHLEGDGDAMVKPRPAPEEAEGTGHPSIPPGYDPERERAGWIMAQKFGLESPAVVVRDVATQDIGDASVQQWREFRPWTGGGTEAEKRRIGLFDVVIGNVDRHGGQLGMTPEGKLLAYDHGLAFPSWVVDTSATGRSIARDYSAYQYEWTTNDVMARGFYGSYLTADELTLLRSLDTPAIRAELRATGLDQEAIDRMYHRIHALQENAQFMKIEDADKHGMTQSEISESIHKAMTNWNDSGANPRGVFLG